MESSSSSEVDTLVKVYNRFVSSFIQDASEHRPQLKAELKALGVAAVAPGSHTHIKHAASCVPRTVLASSSLDAVLSDEAVLAFEPIKGLRLGAIAHEGGGGTREVLSYVYLLSVLASTYADCASTTPEGASDLASAVLAALSKAQVDGEAPDVNILDDELSAMLERVGELSSSSKSKSVQEDAAAADVDVEGILKSLENSKIADLAKEISSEIDIKDLGANPMDMLNFANLTDSNSVLGNIVSKVGSKIQTKLSNGEMKQDELVSEAVSLLKALDQGGQMANNPMLSGLFKAAKSGKLSVNTANVRTSSARERLRKKLEKQRERGE